MTAHLVMTNASNVEKEDILLVIAEIGLGHHYICLYIYHNILRLSKKKFNLVMHLKQSRWTEDKYSFLAFYISFCARSGGGGGRSFRDDRRRSRSRSRSPPRREARRY